MRITVDDMRAGENTMAWRIGIGTADIGRISATAGKVCRRVWTDGMIVQEKPGIAGPGAGEDKLVKETEAGSPRSIERQDPPETTSDLRHHGACSALRS
jgi:hypothetical protein